MSKQKKPDPSKIRFENMRFLVQITKITKFFLTFFVFVIFISFHDAFRAETPPLTVISGKPLMVSRGNSFRVECSVQSEIDYCWLRHPNGTTVPVTVPDSAADRKRKTRYRYAGEGLSFGQCHVMVDEASASDTGTWLCALGLRDDRREVYGKVNVTVSGKYTVTLPPAGLAVTGDEVRVELFVNPIKCRHV